MMLKSSIIPARSASTAASFGLPPILKWNAKCPDLEQARPVCVHVPACVQIRAEENGPSLCQKAKLLSKTPGTVLKEQES